MSHLILTRKAGESVRLTMGDKTEYVELLEIRGKTCKFRLLSNPIVERVQLKEFFTPVPGVEIHILGIAGGQAKLGFNAPKDVHILRTELVGRVAK